MECLITAPGRAAAQKGSHFVAIAANGHGTPATSMSARIIVKKQTAGWVRATADGSTRAFDEEFRRGPC